jgi:small-conductance mechanosensitive channel
VVPNSEFMNSKVTNWTLLEGYCRIHLSFRVAYGTDIAALTGSCQAANPCLRNA